MSIASRIEAIEQHLTDDYSVLTLAGADLTNVDKNILNLKLTWKERLLYFMNNGTDVVWDNWDKVTGEGTSITLNNTEEAPMKIVLKGNTSQETTTGKNLFAGGDTTTTNGITFTKHSDGSYDIVGTATSPAYILNYVPLAESGIVNGETYTISTNQNITGLEIRIESYNGNTWLRATLGGLITFPKTHSADVTGATSVRFGLFVNSGTTINLKNLKIQLEKGSSVTSFEPYTGGIPAPSPDYPQDIHVVSGDNSIVVKGYNLYNANDTNAVANGYIIQSDGTLKLNEIDNTSGSPPIFKNFTLPITQFKTNTTYTFVLEILSVSGSGHITMNESNATTQFNAISSLASKTFDSLHAGDIIVGTATTKADFTNCTRALSSYCYFLAGEKGSITFRLSIIEGSSVTPQTFIYQPYKSASYPISLGDIELCKIGNYQDKIDKSSGKNSFNPQDFITAMSTNYREIKTTDGVEFICLGRSQSTTTTYTYELNCKENTQYALSFKYISSSCGLRILYSDGTDSGSLTPNKTTLTDVSYTSEANKTITGISLYCGGWYASGNKLEIAQIMLNEGTTALPYEPYGTGWYLKKEIGKVVLDGSENWTTNSGWHYTNTNIYILNQNPKTTEQVYSDKFFFYRSAYANDINGEVGIVWGSTLSFRILNTIASDTEAFKTWLGTHNTTLYYVLATPTYTEITDSTLISQLNALAKSYNNQTNISQNNNDSPFIINATALREMS